jgi:hypothetical protein
MEEPQDLEVTLEAVVAPTQAVEHRQAMVILSVHVDIAIRS